MYDTRQKVELYLHSPIRLDGAALNEAQGQFDQLCMI
jgi:hypothetical protein